MKRDTMEPSEETLEPLFKVANTEIWKQCSQTAIYQQIRKKYKEHLQDESLSNEIRFEIPNEDVEIEGTVPVESSHPNINHGFAKVKLLVKLKKTSDWHKACVILTQVDQTQFALDVEVNFKKYEEGIQVVNEGYGPWQFGRQVIWNSKDIVSAFKVELVLSIPRAHQQYQQVFGSFSGQTETLVANFDRIRWKLYTQRFDGDWIH